ncbi:MAG: HlyD family efflux transporter periplasmic adaptor subunit [Clostridium sp.]
MIKKIGIRNSTIYLFCLLIIYLTFIYKIPVDVVSAKYYEYEDKLAFRGIYFTKESVIYNQPKENLPNINVENGSRVSKGTKISGGLTNNEVGIMLFNVDGYENKYNLENIMSLNLSEMDKIINKSTNSYGIKVIDSDNLYLYGYIGKDGGFKKNQKLYMLINNKKYLFKVIDIASRKEGNFLVIKMIDDIEYKNLHRGISGDIIKSNYSGIKVPSNTIIMKDSEYKVLVRKSNGYVVEKGINVLYDDSEGAIIEPKQGSTLAQYDEIIVNPSYRIKDGTRVR